MSTTHPVATTLHALKELLEREKARGRSHVEIEPETNRLLAQIPQFLRQAQAPSPIATQSATVAPAAPANTPSTAPATPATPAPTATRPVDTAVPVAETSTTAPAPATASTPPRTEAWVREQLNGIFREVKNDENLRSLGTLFETVVFATGNPMADLVFVGEAPGAEEEKQRKPFVGPAGQKLNQILQAMGLAREEVYITNIVKYRPKKGDGRFQGASIRKPDVMEMAASISYVRREMEIIQPKVIVALGATAAEGLLEIGGSVAGLRKQTHTFAGVPLVVTYHPSYLLRQETENPEGARNLKRTIWEDMLRAMEFLGMPISDKQRSYFL